MRPAKLKATVVNFREGGQRSSPLFSASGRAPRTPANGYGNTQKKGFTHLTAGLLHADAGTQLPCAALKYYSLSMRPFLSLAHGGSYLAAECIHSTPGTAARVHSVRTTTRWQVDGHSDCCMWKKVVPYRVFDYDSGVASLHFRLVVDIISSLWRSYNIFRSCPR